MKKRKVLLGIMMLAPMVLASCNGLEVESTKESITRTTTGETQATATDAVKYQVTFIVNGGSEIAPAEVLKGSRIEKPLDPVKEGYTFLGWYSDKYYFMEYDFTYSVTRDITLYAKWEEIPKVMSYDVGNPAINFWTNSINTRWMKIAVPVTNTGEADIYLSDISIDIEDSTGKLLQTKSYINGYPEYLGPNETGYYYCETTCDFSESNVNVIPHLEVEKAKREVIRYAISDVSINSDTYNGVKIIGRVENTTDTKGSLVQVVANLFDKDGNLICNCYTYLENTLEAGRKVGFSITPYAYSNLTPEDIASYEIYAYPTQLNW